MGLLVHSFFMVTRHTSYGLRRNKNFSRLGEIFWFRLYTSSPTGTCNLQKLQCKQYKHELQCILRVFDSQDLGNILTFQLESEVGE